MIKQNPNQHTKKSFPIKARMSFLNKNIFIPFIKRVSSKNNKIKRISIKNKIKRIFIKSKNKKISKIKHCLKNIQIKILYMKIKTIIYQKMKETGIMLIITGLITRFMQAVSTNVKSWNPDRIPRTTILGT